MRTKSMFLPFKVIDCPCFKYCTRVEGSYRKDITFVKGSWLGRLCICSLRIALMLESGWSYLKQLSE